MKFLMVVLSVLVTISVRAQMNPMNAGDCSQMVNGLVGYTGGTMDAKSGFKPLLIFKDGKLTVDKTSSTYRSYEKSGNKEIINYTYQNMQCPSCKVNLPKTSSGRVELTTTPDGYVVANFYDENQMKAMYGGSAYHPVGNENTLKNQGNNTCIFDQMSQLNRMADGNIARNVIGDKKYCDSMKDTLRKIGKESFDKCADVLQKAQETYNARAMELMQKKESFTPSGQNSFGGGMQATLWALNSCSPDEWDKNIMNVTTAPYGYASKVGLFENTNPAPKNGVLPASKTDAGAQ